MCVSPIGCNHRVIEYNDNSDNNCDDSNDDDDGNDNNNVSNSTTLVHRSVARSLVQGESLVSIVNGGLLTWHLGVHKPQDQSVSYITLSTSILLIYGIARPLSKRMSHPDAGLDDSEVESDGVATRPLTIRLRARGYSRAEGIDKSTLFIHLIPLCV